MAPERSSTTSGPNNPTQPEPTTRIGQRALKQAPSEVVFAAASDEARPILTGVLTRFEGDRLTLAAADNYRIAVKTLTTPAPVEETSIVVPARSYHELERVLAHTDDPVDVLGECDQPRCHVQGVAGVGGLE